MQRNKKVYLYTGGEGRGETINKDSQKVQTPSYKINSSGDVMYSLVFLVVSHQVLT